MSPARPTVATESHWRDVADKYLAEMAGLRAHIAALEADNAALVSHLRTLTGGAFTFSEADAAKSAACEPRPGAALLERHEKELVRAMNEAREKIAVKLLAHRDALRSRVDAAGRCRGLEEGAGIARAQMEPEQ